jgi:hypothetical protein
LRQWLLVVTIAAGLIGMHHFVVPAGPDHDTRPAVGMAAGTAPTHPGMAASLMDTAARGAAVVDTAAGRAGAVARGGDIRAQYGDDLVSSSVSGCCPCMGAMMGHPCQAVLSGDARTMAEAMLLAAATASHDAPPPLASAAASTLPARSPPSNGIRISQLSVWRR